MLRTKNLQKPLKSHRKPQFQVRIGSVGDTVEDCQARSSHQRADHRSAKVEKDAKINSKAKNDEKTVFVMFETIRRSKSNATRH